MIRTVLVGSVWEGKTEETYRGPREVGKVGKRM